MDERSDQILNHIEEQRSRLGQNLNELENRVRSTADWRAQFEKNPMLMLGVALGGGILLGAMVGGPSGRHRRGYPASGRSKASAGYRSGAPDLAAGTGLSYAAVESDRTSSTDTEYQTESTHLASEQYRPKKQRRESPAVAQQKERAVHTLDNIKAALIAFGIDKAKEFLSEALPGFDRHLAEAEQKSREWSQPSGQSQGMNTAYDRPSEFGSEQQSDYSTESSRVYIPGDESTYSQRPNVP